MFENTLLRLEGLSNIEPPIVVCNNDHRFMVAEQLQELEISDAVIALEPEGRNTAHAIAAAALAALSNFESKSDDPLLLVLAADHEITNVSAFHEAIAEAEKAALGGALVTFGIVPTKAHTGYGYIKASGSSCSGCAALDVDRFVEKPDQDTATAYVDSGDYFWNSGMFMFKASVFLSELGQFSPEIVAACKLAVENAKSDMDFLRLDPESFATSPSDSIDYAVMEKTTRAKLIPLDAGWNDVGAWPSLWDLSAKDDNNNVFVGDVLTDDVHNSYVYSDNRLVSVVGLDDVVVVETDDAVMVAHKDKAQNVKAITEQLKQQGRDELNNHRKVLLPPEPVFR